MIHELGHEQASDHFSRQYNDALTRLGAEATLLALSEPHLFDLSRYAPSSNRTLLDLASDLAGGVFLGLDSTGEFHEVASDMASGPLVEEIRIAMSDSFDADEIEDEEMFEALGDLVTELRDAEVLNGEFHEASCEMSGRRALEKLQTVIEERASPGFKA